MSRDGRARFHFELHCHKPELYFRRNNEKRLTNDQFRAPQGRGRGSVAPAWQNQTSLGNHYGPSRGSDAQQPSPYDKVADVNGKSFVNRIKSCLMNDKALRRMHNDTDNRMPHIAIPISNVINTASILALYDTGGALNTGNLGYHNYIKSALPSAVLKFEEFNGSNPFDPIKLEGAILNMSDYDAQKHGILSAVITYRTPFKLPSGGNMSLSFALGKDMSVDTIIGMPFIKNFQLELRFAPDKFLSHLLKKEFKVVYAETKLTVPTISNQESI